MSFRHALAGAVLGALFLIPSVSHANEIHTFKYDSFATPTVNNFDTIRGGMYNSNGCDVATGEKPSGAGCAFGLHSGTPIITIGDDFRRFDFNLISNAVPLDLTTPEPSSLAMLGIGLALLGGLKARKSFGALRSA